MKYRRQKFFILEDGGYYDSKKKRKVEHVKVAHVYGYVFEYEDVHGKMHQMGVFKTVKGSWRVTCLLTGRYIIERGTREDAVNAFLNTFANTYAGYLDSPKMKVMREEYARFVDEYERGEQC